MYHAPRNMYLHYRLGVVWVKWIYYFYKILPFSVLEVIVVESLQLRVEPKLRRRRGRVACAMLWETEDWEAESRRAESRAWARERAGEHTHVSVIAGAGRWCQRLTRSVSEQVRSAVDRVDGWRVASGLETAEVGRWSDALASLVAEGESSAGKKEKTRDCAANHLRNW